MLAATGGDELRALALALKRAGDKPMGQRLRRQLTAATGDFEQQAKDAFIAAMPSRGGYAGVLGRAFRVRISVRASSSDARVTAIGYADGRKERRDLPRLESGVLRHPVFGRSRRLTAGPRAGTAIRNPWATTKVQPGAWQRTVDDTGQRVHERMLAVLDEISSEVMGG